MSTTLTIILLSSFSHPNRIQHALSLLTGEKELVRVTLEVQLKWREEGRKFGRTKGKSGV